MSDSIAPPDPKTVPIVGDFAPTPAGLTGLALIQDEVKRLPDSPGVYRMIGGRGGGALRRQGAPR